MIQPKFAVGEVVILQSKRLPHLNGEHSVIALVFDGKTAVCPATGKDAVNGTGLPFCYILDDMHVDVDGLCVFWGELALRKRHQPGNMTWESLRQSLSRPVAREEFATSHCQGGAGHD